MFNYDASKQSTLKGNRIIEISHREGLEEVKTNERTSVLSTISDMSEQLMTIVKDVSSYLNVNSILGVRASDNGKLLIGVTPTQEEQEIIQSEEEQRLEVERLEVERLEEERKLKMDKLGWLGKLREKKVEKELAKRKEEEREKAKKHDEKAKKQAEKNPDVVEFIGFRGQLQFGDRGPNAASLEEVARIKEKIAKDEAEAGKFVIEAQNELKTREDTLADIIERIADLGKEIEIKQSEIDTKQSEIDTKQSEISTNEETLGQKADLIVRKEGEETEKKGELERLVASNQEIGQKVKTARTERTRAKSNTTSKRRAFTKAEGLDVLPKKGQSKIDALQAQVENLKLLKSELEKAELAQRKAENKVERLETEQSDLLESFETRKEEIESKLDIIQSEKTRANEVITEITKVQESLETEKSELVKQKEDLIAQKDELDGLLTQENTTKTTAEGLLQEALRKLEAEQEKLAVSGDIEKSAKFARIAFDEKMKADRLEHKIKTLVDKEIISLTYAKEEIDIEKITQRIRGEVAESMKTQTEADEDDTRNPEDNDIVQRIGTPDIDLDGGNAATNAARSLLKN